MVPTGVERSALAPTGWSFGDLGCLAYLCLTSFDLLSPCTPKSLSSQPSGGVKSSMSSP